MALYEELCAAYKDLLAVRFDPTVEKSEKDKKAIDKLLAAYSKALDATEKQPKRMSERVYRALWERENERSGLDSKKTIMVRSYERIFR